ncbi:DNA replication terminus site-binding protein [Aeromonas hydrophila]|uniref:DNA replication terminus site-binding protein n=1 Tax=Aeromonas hydrophila TaxID=644 RepID=UPI00209C6FB9|nr:DNA replication terminus site-binding protein [Aeromonas hydrophila]MCP1265100.1 DNA replication terminus site-binding protein [Aeromonas hydrophila]MCP1293601.1 DNA replication terminus site-binding protein [Aeromonas hydrophila]
METFTPTAALRQQMERLEQALDNLAAQLEQLELLEAHVYPLPAVPQGQEHEPIEQIEVGYLGEEAALAATLSAYRDHSARPGCSTKATHRLPGWLRFPAACAPLLRPLIDEVNECKLAFKALVQQAGGRDEKFELVHRALPGVITLQVYRKLTWLQGELHSLGFTWADKQSISRLSRELVLEMLERSRRYIPALSNNEEWSKMVDQEVYDIRRLPADAELRIRRPVKTHPMINLLWQDREPRKQQLKASLPLLLCSDTLPAVTHLGHYPPKLRQARRDRKIGGEPIIERLHLYLYQG